MLFAQLLLVNDDTYDYNNLLIMKANTIMKGMEGTSEILRRVL